jgi:HSP20 family protein
MHKAFESLVELTRLQSEINKLFEQLFGSYEHAESTEQIWYPNVDLVETPTELQVSVELPGISSDEIKIYISGQLLVIQGNKKKNKDKFQQLKILRIEREYGPFYRAIQINTAVNPLKGMANLVNGILRIKIPKIEDKRAKKVEIIVEKPPEPNL